MKRVAVSTVTALCGLLLTTTAHASFVERSFANDPSWKTQEEVDAETEIRIDARTTVESLKERTDGTFDETDTRSDDAEFGNKLVEQDIVIATPGTVTRAEFTAMVVRSEYTQASIDSCYRDITSVWPPDFTLLFRDVAVDHAYAPEICVAMRDGLVRGYGNDVFRPDAQVAFADAAKMLSRTHGLTPWADQAKPKHWFDQYVSALARRNAIPTSVSTIEKRITPEEAGEMIRRLHTDDRTQESRSADEMIAAWEKAHARRVVRPVTTVYAPKKPSSSAGANASVGTTSSAAAAIDSKKTVPAAPSSAASTGGQTSSREKAWYEF